MAKKVTHKVNNHSYKGTATFEGVSNKITEKQIAMLCGQFDYVTGELEGMTSEEAYSLCKMEIENSK